MNKVFVVGFVLIVGMIIYFLQKDVKVENVIINESIEIEEVREEVVINSEPFIIEDLKTSPKNIKTSVKPEECFDILICEEFVTNEMKEKFGLKEFVYSPTNDMNKANLYETGNDESQFLKIGVAGDRDVYVFELNGYIGEGFKGEIDFEDDNLKLLNDEYLVFYDDEITIKFEASNSFQNVVMYIINSQLYDARFEFGKSTHINKMPMCEEKSITMEMVGKSILPVVPGCNGPMAKQSDMVKVSDAALISCMFYRFTMPNEVYINLDQILYLNCSGENIDNIKFDGVFENLQAVRIYGEFTDAQFLKKQQSIRFLNFKSVSLYDYSDIASLNIEGLSIEHSQINESNGFSSLSFLTSLSVNHSKVESFEFLTYLDKLKYLNLDSQQLEVLPDLIGNRGLVSLDVRNNKLTDLSGVEVLTELKELIFKKNKVKDVSNIDFASKEFDVVDGRLNPIDCSTFNGVRSDGIQIICP